MNWRFAAVMLIAAAHFLNLLPTLLNFDRFAFGDNGWPLTVDVLIAEEHRTPTADFAYYYGLLVLLVDRIAFALFGRTPETIVGLYAVCALAVAIGAARLMAALNLRLLPSVFLITCTSLIVIPRGFPSPAHALEAAFLMTALAAHARGRLDRALVFCVLAVLAKPALGYVYGLILVGLVLAGWPAGESRWRRFLPAAAVAAVLLIIVGIRFGIEPVARTLFPAAGLKVYGDEGVGFLFGAGRLFWLPEDPTLWYYTGVPGVWLASSLVLFAAALRMAPRWNQTEANVAVTCAVLHGVFLFALFGNQWSWIYYSNVLFAGTAVALNGLPRRLSGTLAIVLSIAAFVAQIAWLWGTDARTWVFTQRHVDTAGLYAPPEEAAEWEKVRDLGRQNPGRVFVLTRMGCPHLLAPELDAPRSWCLIRAVAPQAEMDRIREQIGRAEWIVSPAWHDNDLMTWPELAEVLKPFREEGSTPFFKMYRRAK